MELTYGVSSEVDGDKHILIWDFDEQKLTNISNELQKVSEAYKLSNIYVLETSPDRYAAICFSAFDWPTALLIVARTKYVDENFLKLSIRQRFFTLRVGPKGGFRPRCVLVISSDVAETPLNDLQTWYVYVTGRKEAYRPLQDCIADQHLVDWFQGRLAEVLSTKLEDREVRE
ncbi:MAG: hypothetical protein DRJ38_00435 [Thermoprotei archaeon]|nr:MAG: hypothetical protein DRJ38_00435 [Thermoprotei archaeon]